MRRCQVSMECMESLHAAVSPGHAHLATKLGYSLDKVVTDL